MAYRVTNNHELIRAWIEERGGVPAVLRGATDTVNSLSIQFAGNGDLEPISWEELFDMLDTNSLSFRYDPQAEAHNEGAFNFVSRDSVPQLDDKDSLLPEENEMLEGNMYPSSSSEHAGEEEPDAA